jgi:hypothetical protein
MLVKNYLEMTKEEKQFYLFEQIKDLSLSVKFLGSVCQNDWNEFPSSEENFRTIHDHIDEIHSKLDSWQSRLLELKEEFKH